MTLMRFVVLVFFVTIKPTYQENCNDEICLKWTLREERLELVCKIRQPYNLVHIENPEGCIVADCLPYSPYDCSTYPEFSKFYYDFAIASFVFNMIILPGIHIQGVWKCKHGRNGKTAEVFIRNHNEKTSTRENLTTEKESTTVYTGIENNNQEESHPSEKILEVLKRYGIPMGMVLVSVIILSVAVKIFINLKRLTRNNQAENRQTDINLHDDANHISSPVSVGDQPYETEHDYESVNEDEMIPDENLLEILTDEQESNSDKTSASSSLDTNNPYLDVVHDFPVDNEYEKADNINEQEVSHDYNTIVNCLQPATIYVNELI